MPKQKLPSGISLTREGTYQYRWREYGKQRSATCKTLEAAEAKKAEVQARLASGKRVVRSHDAPTLHEFATSWLARKVKLSDRTLKDYVEALERHVLPQLGHFPVSELRPRVVGEWQEERLESGAGPVALRKAQGIFAQILDRAVLPHEYLDANPVRMLEPLESGKRRSRWLSAPEVERLRRWYLDRGDRLSAAFISLQAYVGLRPEDTLARTWADLSPEGLFVATKNVDGEILSGSKTGEGYKRTVLVPQAVQEELHALRGDSIGLIIGRPSDGKPWTRSDFNNWRLRQPRAKGGKRPKCFRRAVEECGLEEGLRVYDLRHTAASIFAHAGWTAHGIAHQLGHGVEVSHRLYQHLIKTPDAPRESVDEQIAAAREDGPGGLRLVA